MQATTKILNIIFSVGRTGVVTPVAEMEPVFLSGSTITHSTLHNFDEIQRKDIRTNDTVIIEKAGEVIPQVVKVVLEKRPKHAKTLKPPTHCPVCKSKLFKESDEVALRCINASCPAQIKGRLLLFACRSAMDINGFGFSLVEMLVEKKLVCDFADIYDLKHDDLINLERMGEKSVNNLLQAIQESKQRPYNRVLFALGIRHIGIHTARLLVSAFPSIDKLCKAKKDEIASVMGIGLTVAESVRNFFDDEENMQLIERLIKTGLNFSEDISEKGNKPLIGKTFVLTGTLKNYTREQATELIIEKGGNVTSSVSKKTNYVLAGDEPGSKYDKAQKLKVKIINEQEFNKIIKKK
jgi:DNA ligase (NAD+)